MSLTAKRGEFTIAFDASGRNVESYPRQRASTFSPSATTSRFGVTDSGTRYEIQLERGPGDANPVRVRIRRDGGDREFLAPKDGQPWASAC